VAAADVNGDGRPDLLVANRGPSTVSVLLNTTAPGAATPSFAAATNFPVGSNPESVSTADVNGDGRPDLLVANANSANVSVLLNQTAPGAATPSFTAATNLPVGSDPASVAGADVNGDGRPDLVTANPGANSVSVLLNLTAPGAPTPSFAPAASFAAGGGPGSVAAADVNGDGRPDLLVANSNSATVSVLLNTTAPGAPTPSFAPAASFGAGTSPTSVAAADVNNDGRPDLLVTTPGSDTVSVLLNTTLPFGRTTTTFAAAAHFGAGSGPASVAAADVNGDGQFDLLVANSGANTVSALLNTTAPGALTPSFAPQSTFPVGDLANPQAVAAADVNGDGRPDLLVANSGTDTVAVLLNTTAPGAVPPGFAPAANFGAGSAPASVAAADVNGDGRPDLLVANRGTDTVAVLLNTTAPGAATPRFAAPASFVAGSGPTSVAAADVNGDGRPDLLVATASNVAVLFNTTVPGATTPSFAAATSFPAGSGPTSVAAADVNGDGRPDLLVATASSVAVLLNTTFPGATTPSFAAATSFPVGSSPQAVAAVDVNGDGRRDLLVANQGANTVSVLLNTTAPGATTPSFAAAVSSAVGSGPTSVAAADVNTDGCPDLLAANSGAANVSVLLNSCRDLTLLPPPPATATPTRTPTPTPTRTRTPTPSSGPPVAPPFLPPPLAPAPLLPPLVPPPPFLPPPPVLPSADAVAPEVPVIPETESGVLLGLALAALGVLARWRGR
jgi:hypothetical protein